MQGMTRKQYEAFQTLLLCSAGYSRQEAADFGARQYPKSTEATVHELRIRGFDAPPWRVEQYVRQGTVVPRIVGKMRLWFPQEIDAFAAFLDAEGHWGPEAKACHEKGVEYGAALFGVREENHLVAEVTEDVRSW